MSARARITPVNRNAQDYELQALFGKNGALSRSSGGSLSANFTTGEDGISVFTVTDNHGNKLTLEGEAVTGVNNVGAVWRVGDFSTNAYVPIINPKLTGVLDPNSNKVSFDVKTSTERLAEKINSSFDSFYKRKKGDDTSVLGFFRRELSRTIFAESDPDKIEAILNAGHSQSYDLQRNLMSTTIVGYSVLDPTSKYGFSKASPIQEGRVDQAIGEMVGINTPLNTSEPFAIEKSVFYKENGKTVQATRPLSGIDVHALNTRTGYLDMSPNVGPYSSSEVIYHRDDKGQVLKDQFGPIVERVELQTAFAKGGAGYIKSKTVPGAGIVPTEMTPVMEDVWDSEKNEFVKRKVMREVQPQERYDNQPAPAVMRLNLRTSGEGEQENTSRVGEVKNLLIAPWTVPGAAGVFGDSRGRIVKQYANIKDKEIDTPAFSMLEAQSNQVQFNINPASVIGDVGNRPKSTKRLGAIQIGDKQTDLSFSLPQAKTNIAGMYLQVPRYVSDDLKSWSSSEGNGYREVNDTDLNVLRNILPQGFGASVSNVAEAPGLFAQMSTQSAANDSGSGIKQGVDLMPTIRMNRSQGRGRDRVDIPIDMISGEIKHPSIFFMEAGFGARSTAQQKGILSSYLRTQYMRSGSKGKHQLRSISEDEVNQWFSDMSAGFTPGQDSANPQYGYKMHWSDITQFLNQKLGKNMTELEAGESVFNTVFAEEDKLDTTGNAVSINPSGKKNLENIKNFEIGYTDEPIPLRGIHRDRLALMRESYRRSAQDLGWTDDQIEAGFNRTFQMTPVPDTDVYNGRMVLTDENGKSIPFLSINAALVKKAESIGGGGLGPEAGSMIYEHDPELSRRMRNDPSEIGLQSPNNRSLLQLRKWLAVEQSISSGDINTSNLKVDSSSTFNAEQDTPGLVELLDAASNYDPKQTGAYSALMDQVTGIVGGRDQEIYFPSLNAFLPPVNTAENTLNYEQDGVQNSRGGIEWISSLKSMIEETMNSEPGTVNEEAGRTALSGLERHVSEMFEKGGDANKDMFKREIPFSASMRYGSMSILGNNQAWMNKETRRRVMLDSGLSREGIKEFEKSLSQSYTDFKSGQSSVMGVPMVSFRWPPQAGGNAISDMNLMPDEYVAETLKKVGKATGERVNINETLSSGRYNDIFFVSSQYSAEKFGDYDYDPGWFAWLVQNKETDEGKTEFYKLVEDTWQGYRSHDPGRVQEIEENVLGINQEDPRKLSPLVDKVSADLAAMKDIIAGKDPMKAKSGMGIAKSDLSQFARDTIAVHENATKGMGTTYNLRRAMEFALESNGFGMTDVSNAKAMAQAHYQPYLDKMYNIGAQIEGTELATMASRATIKQNENGNPYLQLTTSSEDSDHNKVKKVYFDDRGQGILSAYSWMLRVAEKGIVSNTNKSKTKYEVTQNKLLAALASPSKELEPRIMAALQDENYGTTRSARALGAVSEWINEAGSENERVERRKSVARSALFKLPFFNALGKKSYDANNNVLPGNFGESPVQAAMLRHLEDTGFGRDFAEELQAGAVNLALQTGGKKGFAPAHILNKALGITRNIISSKFGSDVGELPAGIQNMIAKMEALGGLNVADSNDPTWKEAASNLDMARRAIRNISDSAVDLDVETTGITYGANGKLESTGRIWQVGINGQSQVVNPGLSKDEYTKLYDAAMKASGPDSWAKHLPKPEDFDKAFGNAPTFAELWKSGGLRESILDAGGWTSYTSFDRTAILGELRNARTSSQDKDYWTDEIDAFKKSNYVNLYSDSSGNVLHLGEIFKDEIKRYNEAPEHLSGSAAPLTNKLQDIAKALAWEGNKDATNDVFPDQESRERFVDLVGRQELAHDAGYDSGILGALRVGAINRVRAFDSAEINRANARNDARSRGYVFKPVINQRVNDPAGNAYNPTGQNSPEGNPPLREIRASMMDHDPDTEEGRSALMVAFAGEELGRNSIPSQESVGGQKVHNEAQALLEAQDPDSQWQAEAPGSVVLGDVKVSGTVDDVSKVKNRIIDFKSDSGSQHPFQMKIYEMIHGVPTFIARYSRTQRNNKQYGNAAQGVVDKVLSGSGLERGTTKSDVEAAERARKIADFKEQYQPEIHDLAEKIRNGDIDIPTDENSLLKFQDILARIAPHISGVTQFAPSQEPPSAGQSSQASQPKYWSGQARVNPQRVNEMREQLIRLSKSLEASKPFILESMNNAPTTPGAPGMKFFQGAIQAAMSFDVVNGGGRNAARAAIESLELFRKVSNSDDTVLAEAFSTVPEDVQRTISEHPYNNIVSNPDVNVLMDTVVGGLNARLTRSAKGAIDRQKDIRIYQDFFSRSDVGQTRDALGQYLAADPGHTAKGFFQDVIANRDTSPHAAVLAQMDKNAVSLFSAVEHLRSKNMAVDPLLTAYEDSLDADMKRLFRNPDKLSGWNKQYDDAFYDAAQKKALFNPETLGWKLQMAQEDILQAEAKLNTATLERDAAINGGASPAAINKNKFLVAQAVQGVQKAQRAYREIELSDNMRNFSPYSDYADSLTATPFKKALEVFGRTNGTSEEKIQAAIAVSPEAKGAMVHARYLFSSVPSALKPETGPEVQEFFTAMDAVKREDKTGLLDISNPLEEINKVAALDTASRIFGEKDIADLSAAFEKSGLSEREFFSRIAQNPLANTAQVGALRKLLKNSAALKKATKLGKGSKIFDAVLSGVDTSMEKIFEDPVKFEVEREFSRRSSATIESLGDQIDTFQKSGQALNEPAEYDLLVGQREYLLKKRDYEESLKKADDTTRLNNGVRDEQLYAEAESKRAAMQGKQNKVAELSIKARGVRDDRLNYVLDFLGNNQGFTTGYNAFNAATGQNMVANLQGAATTEEARAGLLQGILHYRDLSDNQRKLVDARFPGMGHLLTATELAKNEGFDLNKAAAPQAEQTLLDSGFVKGFSDKMKKYLSDLGDMTDELTRKTGGLNEVRGKEARILDLQIKALQSKVDIQQSDLEVESLKAKKPEMDKLPENSLERLSYEKSLSEAIQRQSNTRVRGEKLSPYYDPDHPDEAKTAATGAVEAQMRDEEKTAGSFFRYVFGGFGLMYLRSVAGIAAEPLLSGYQQRMKSQQEIGGTIFGVLGGSREGNSDEELARAQGLYMGGQGWQAVQQGLAAATRSAPGTISALENVATGVSMYGATTWMLSQVPNKRTLTGMSQDDWAKLEKSDQDTAVNDSIAGLSGAIALTGMLSTNVINMYGAYNNPNVTSRSIASRAANGGWSNGFDPLGMVISGASGGVAGAMTGTLAGVPMGTWIGGLLGAVTEAGTSQKDMWAYYTNSTIRSQADRGSATLGYLGGNSGITSSLGIAGYNPNNLNEGIAQIVYSLSANPEYSDISQQALAMAVSSSVKVGYDFNQGQIVTLARQIDRGVDFIGLSREVTTLAGAGALDFAKPSGRTETKDIYKAVRPNQIAGSMDSWKAFHGKTDNDFGIVWGSNEVRKYDSVADFQKYSAANGLSISENLSLNLGGQGDNLSNVQYSQNQNGSYDVWGITGNGQVQGLGTTENPIQSNNALKNSFSTGSKTSNISVGQDMVETLLKLVDDSSKADGSGTFEEEKLKAGLEKLSELKILNKDNVGTFSQNAQAWKDRADKAYAITGTLEEQRLNADVQIWQAQKSLGLKTNADAPDILNKKYDPGQMSDSDLQKELDRANAEMDVLKRKQSMSASAFSIQQQYGIGNPDLFTNQVANMTPAQLGVVESLMTLQGPTFGNMVRQFGAGTMIPSEQLITAGVSNNTIDMGWMYSGGYTNMSGPNGQSQRVATNLGWGQGGNDFGWGAYNQTTTLNNMLGNQWRSNPIMASAVAGVPLSNPITLPNGSQISSLQGFEAVNWNIRQEDYAQQMFSIQQQLKGANLSYAFTTGRGLSKYGNLPAGGEWGIQQREMELGWNQQEFGFQMQQKQMDLSSSQFAENMALQQKQMKLSRSFTQEDWGINQMVRDLQWGWKQQDYAEESRFMTGRQRRLADRQMGRESIMHDIEGDQIDRQITRQKEMWKLEDERFATQKKQFEESKKLQEEQLAANRNFFQQSKALQLESQALQHAQFLEQFKLQMEGIAYSQQHAAIMKNLQDLMQLASVAAAQYQAQIAAVGSVGIASMVGWAEQLIPELQSVFQTIQNFVNANVAKASSLNAYYGSGTQTGQNNPSNPMANPPLASSSVVSALPQTTSFISMNAASKSSNPTQSVVLNLDGQTVQRWVIDTVTGALV